MDADVHNVPQAIFVPANCDAIDDCARHSTSLLMVTSWSIMLWLFITLPGCLVGDLLHEVAIGLAWYPLG